MCSGQREHVQRLRHKQKQSTVKRLEPSIQGEEDWQTRPKLNGSHGPVSAGPHGPPERVDSDEGLSRRVRPIIYFFLIDFY